MLPIHVLRRIIAISIFFGFCSSKTIGQVAYLEGAVVKMPVVVVGETLYSVDLSIIPGRDPIAFSLAAAFEISAGDTNNVPYLEGAVLKIPTIIVDGTDFFVDLNLINDNPIEFQLGDFGSRLGGQPEQREALRAEALRLFEQNLAVQIVSGRCIVCHVQGGLASGAIIVFERQSTSSTEHNFQVLSSFVQSRNDAVSYMLSKVSGSDHIGGVQIPAGSTEYVNLEAFLNTLNSSFGK